MDWIQWRPEENAIEDLGKEEPDKKLTVTQECCEFAGQSTLVHMTFPGSDTRILGISGENHGARERRAGRNKGGWHLQKSTRE